MTKIDNIEDHVIDRLMSHEYMKYVPRVYYHVSWIKEQIAKSENKEIRISTSKLIMLRKVFII